MSDSNGAAVAEDPNSALVKLIAQRDLAPQVLIPVGSEIDTQIATARKYPRSLNTVEQTVRSLVLSSPERAAECRYAVSKGGSKIEGPSVRFAECLVHAWTNCRVASRVISMNARFVTGQGAFMDLENNVAVSFDMKSRITDRDGNVYGESMIETTCAAVGAKALRTASLRGIPKPFWYPLYEETKELARTGGKGRGVSKKLKTDRQKAIEYAQSLGIQPGSVFAALHVKNIDEIDFDKLAELRAYFVAIRDKDSTIEDIFGQGLNARHRQSPRTRPSPIDDMLTGGAAPLEGTDGEQERDDGDYTLEDGTPVGIPTEEEQRRAGLIT